MGDIPFLLILGMLAAVLIWYGWQEERDGRGAEGLFAIGDKEERPQNVDEEEALTPRERVKRLSTHRR